MRWMGRQLVTVDGLYNDEMLDHFIAVKHAWAWQVVRALGGARVLETHGGYGWLTITYALAGAQVVTIERNEQAGECLRQNVRGLDVDIICGDSESVLPTLSLDSYNIVDLDPSGSPQPVLDAVLEQAPRSLKALFVTVGDALYTRFNRKAENQAALRRYPRAYREHWMELDRACREFGRLIVFEHIREAWSNAKLAGYHVWPRTSSARLCVALAEVPMLWGKEEAVSWAEMRRGC